MKTMTDLMFELQEVLRLHAARYPLMEPTDAVKLIYQNEFGGGHLIRNEESCRNYLQQEYHAIAKDSQLPIYESIGNGIVRINLAALQETELEALAQSFIRSAAETVGSMAVFLEKLEVLRRMTADKRLPFSMDELESYLEKYRAAGYPMVSHSQAYRDAYHPAYRVVLEQYSIR